MSRLVVAGVMALVALVLVGVHAGLSEPPVWRGRSGETGPLLEKFSSAGEFNRYVRRLRQQARPMMYDVSEDMAMDAPALPGIEASPAAAEPANPEITNNQTVGVDEGGIVKQIGDFLVVLQDGRLFSADLGREAGAPLRLADRLDVYRSPATAASWYDEMLVLGDRILVTAYNYREQASEISVVRIDDQGRLERQGRFLLSSNDYYSTENYATRLVGDRLVFYAPLALDGGGERGFAWPRIRRADGDGEANAGEALIGPTDVYAPPFEVEWPVLHTVSVCPLRGDMDCRTTAFVGPAMREIYVSPSDVFLWIGAPDGMPWEIDYANRRRQSCPAGEQWRDGSRQPALLYRLPLDGGAIGAVAADGVPADQFAFDSRDGRLRALLARAPAGCTKAGADDSLALLDVPLAAFGRRVEPVADTAYAPLPGIGSGQLENRFLGRWLIYGGRLGWAGVGEDGARPEPGSLVAVPLARPSGWQRIALPHNAVRVERAGADAVVTGYRDASGLMLSYVSLGDRPRLAGTTRLPARFESEGRSHAFNAWVRRDGSGLIGIPTTRAEGRSSRGWSDSESSDLSFVAIGSDKALSSAGEIGAGDRRIVEGYRCEVSCVDWYGNSRPIFTGGRIFALMGTDLVEAELAQGRVRELARLDLTGPQGEAEREAP